MGGVATVVALALVCGSFYLAGVLWQAGDERAAQQREEQRQDEIGARLEAENRPELRDVAPVSLFGPGWQPGADLYTMAFPDWPFAFRTPRPWNCFGGSFDPVPEARVWGCTDGMNYETPPKVAVLLWECQTTCTEQEQATMVEAWLDEPEAAVTAADSPTFYVEVAENERGNYELDLSHFAGDPGVAGGPLRWHLGIYAEAADEDTRVVVHAIVNDILSQVS